MSTHNNFLRSLVFGTVGTGKTSAAIAALEEMAQERLVDRLMEDEVVGDPSVPFAAVQGRVDGLLDKLKEDA